jgi:hypothetical protein
LLWQQIPAPPTNGPPPKLPAQRNLLTTADDARLAATVIARTAQRVLTICTHDLESQVYEYGPFVDAAKRLVLHRRFAKVRVLFMRDLRASHERHALMMLARKLTSHFEIRIAPHEYREDPSTYVIADQHATLFRLQHDRWEGICDLDDRAIARTYLDAFDLAWRAAGTPRSQVALRL